MEYVIAWLVLFVTLAAVWVIVLVVYNLLFEPFDFGPLGSFAGKSALLLAIIATADFIPYVNWFALPFWWLGLMIIFQKDFWECRILVILIWGISVAVQLLLSVLLRE